MTSALTGQPAIRIEGLVKKFGSFTALDVELHRRLAYVPGDVVLWPGLSGGEAIDLQYSKGNRQKVAIVAALAADVELLILDEPTSGLDPLMEAVFQVATFGLTILGPTFNLPDWALDLSPLHHVPNVTATSPDWAGLARLAGFGVAFLAIGFVGFGRRDVI